MPSVQNLPPSRALMVFEVAGRLRNFSAAGRELGMSQAAVSKQIQSLEAALGITLFLRSNRGLTLTSHGRRLHQAVATGLGHIREAVAEIQPRYEEGRVAITTTLALASIWLMPRIARFRAEHPGIDLRVIATDAILDLAAEGIDIGLRYGKGAWPGTVCEQLFRIEMFPVCSPAYLTRIPPLHSIDDLFNATLLHLEEPNSEDADWNVWLRAMGTETRAGGGLRFNNYPLLIQAAVNGQGVALGWGHLIGDLLTGSALTCCLPARQLLEPSFFLVRTDSARSRPEVDAFADWMMRATAALRR